MTNYFVNFCRIFVFWIHVLPKHTSSNQMSKKRNYYILNSVLRLLTMSLWRGFCWSGPIIGMVSSYKNLNSHFCNYRSTWSLFVLGWQPRWFILEDGILSYYSSEEEVNQGCKGSVCVSACDINGKSSAIPNFYWYLFIHYNRLHCFPQCIKQIFTD